MKTLQTLGATIAALAAGPMIAGTSMAAAQDGLRTGHLLVANQQSANVSLIDLRTDSAVFIPIGDGPHEAVIAPSGRTGVVTVYGVGGAPGNKLAVVDIAARRVTKTIDLGEYTRPHGAIFLPGETRVVVTSETTQRLLVVNLETARVEQAISTGAAASHMVAVSADGTRAWTANITPGSVSEIDLTTGAFVRTIAVAPRVEGIAITPDGREVWAGSNTNGTVSVIDTRTGAIVETITGFSLPYRLAMSADGRIAMVCDAQGNAVHVVDVAQRKVTGRVGSLGAPRGVNIAPDGRTAFVTLAADPSVAIIDLTSMTVSRKIGVGTAPDGVWYGRMP
jgi:YVTN family beta-propeller protein